MSYRVNLPKKVPYMKREFNVGGTPVEIKVKGKQAKIKGNIESLIGGNNDKIKKLVDEIVKDYPLPDEPSMIVKQYYENNEIDKVKGVLDPYVQNKHLLRMYPLVLLFSYYYDYIDNITFNEILEEIIGNIIEKANEDPNIIKAGLNTREAIIRDNDFDKYFEIMNLKLKMPKQEIKSTYSPSCNVEVQNIKTKLDYIEKDLEKIKANIRVKNKIYNSIKDVDNILYKLNQAFNKAVKEYSEATK